MKEEKEVKNKTASLMGVIDKFCRENGIEADYGFALYGSDTICRELICRNGEGVAIRIEARQQRDKEEVGVVIEVNRAHCPVKIDLKKECRDIKNIKATNSKLAFFVALNNGLSVGKKTCISPNDFIKLAINLSATVYGKSQENYAF
jgi:hypothetical protein